MNTRPPPLQATRRSGASRKRIANRTSEGANQSPRLQRTQAGRSASGNRPCARLESRCLTTDGRTQAVQAVPMCDLMVGRRGRGAGGVRRTRLPWAEGDSVPVVPIVSSEITSRNDSRPFRRVWAFAARRPEIVVQPEYATAAEFQCLTRADDRGGPVARCGCKARRSPVVLRYLLAHEPFPPSGSLQLDYRDHDRSSRSVEPPLFIRSVPSVLLEFPGRPERAEISSGRGQ